MVQTCLLTTTFFWPFQDMMMLNQESNCRLKPVDHEIKESKISANDIMKKYGQNDGPKRVQRDLSSKPWSLPFSCCHRFVSGPQLSFLPCLGFSCHSGSGPKLHQHKVLESCERLLAQFVPGWKMPRKPKMMLAELASKWDSDADVRGHLRKYQSVLHVEGPTFRPTVASCSCNIATLLPVLQLTQEHLDLIIKRYWEVPIISNSWGWCYCWFFFMSYPTDFDICHCEAPLPF